MKNNDSMKSVLLMALAVILVGGGLAYWQYGNRSAAQAKVDQLTAELPDAEQVQNDLQTSQTELEDYRLRLTHLEKSLPNTAYVPTLLKELETVGQENYLQITGVRPVFAQPGTEEDDTDSSYQKLQIDITGQGTYRSVMDVVAALRVFPKILTIETVALQPRQDMQSKGRELDTTIRLTAFIFKEKLDIGELPQDPNAEGGMASPDGTSTPSDTAAPAPSTTESASAKPKTKTASLNGNPTGGSL